MDPFNLKLTDESLITISSATIISLYDTVIYYPWPIISAIIESLIGTNFRSQIGQKKVIYKGAVEPNAFKVNWLTCQGELVELPKFGNRRLYRNC